MKQLSRTLGVPCLCGLVLVGLALPGCQRILWPEENPVTGKKDGVMNVQRVKFGESARGEDVYLYTLTNANGMAVSITNYGGIITSISAPDRNGAFEDVVLGFDNLEQYQGEHPYFGAVIGRYANRIANAQFTLDGQTHGLFANDGPNSLHGGKEGFDRRVWKAESFTQSGAVGLALEYTSPDGEEGYPGELKAKVVYLLDDSNALKIVYDAETDKPTPINLTNHAYFNLAGQGNGSILGHKMQIMASRFTPVDGNLIPTGELRPVEGSPHDFTAPTAIGERINSEDRQLELGKGYDHNYVLDKEAGELAMAARVVEPESGRVLEVYTTEPGIQFYSGNFLDGSLTGKDGKVYEHRYAFCLETQHFPDSPNQPAFPNVILRPGERYSHTCIYKFGVTGG